MAKQKLTATDWFIIITVILCIAGIIVRVFVIGNNYPSLGNEKIEISFTSGEFDAQLSELIKTDDAYNVKDKAYIGTLADGYSVINVKTYSTSEYGNFTENTVEGRFVLSGSLTVTGMMSKSGVYVSGCGVIGIGDRLVLESEQYTLTVTVTGIISRNGTSQTEETAVTTDIETNEQTAAEAATTQILSD